MKYSNEELLELEKNGVDLSTVDMGPVPKGQKMAPLGEIERYTPPSKGRDEVTK